MQFVVKEEKECERNTIIATLSCRVILSVSRCNTRRTTRRTTRPTYVPTGSCYFHIGRWKFRQGIFGQNSHGSFRILDKICRGRRNISHFRKESTVCFRGRNYQVWVKIVIGRRRRHLQISYRTLRSIQYCNCFASSTILPYGLDLGQIYETVNVTCTLLCC